MKHSRSWAALALLCGLGASVIAANGRHEVESTTDRERRENHGASTHDRSIPLPHAMGASIRQQQHDRSTSSESTTVTEASDEDAGMWPSLRGLLTRIEHWQRDQLDTGGWPRQRATERSSTGCPKALWYGSHLPPEKVVSVSETDEDKTFRHAP